MLYLRLSLNKLFIDCCLDFVRFSSAVILFYFILRAPASVGLVVESAACVAIDIGRAINLF